MYQKNFSEFMRKRRKAKGWSSKKLADIVGIHTNTILNYETGKMEPKLYSALKIADVLDFTLDRDFIKKDGV